MIKRNSPALLDLTNDTNPFPLRQYNLAMEKALVDLPAKPGMFNVRDWMQKYNIDFDDKAPINYAVDVLYSDVEFKAVIATRHWRKLAG